MVYLQPFSLESTLGQWQNISKMEKNLCFLKEFC